MHRRPTFAKWVHGRISTRIWTFQCEKLCGLLFGDAKLQLCNACSACPARDARGMTAPKFTHVYSVNSVQPFHWELVWIYKPNVLWWPCFLLRKRHWTDCKSHSVSNFVYILLVVGGVTMQTIKKPSLTWRFQSCGSQGFRMLEASTMQTKGLA